LGSVRGIYSVFFKFASHISPIFTFHTDIKESKRYNDLVRLFY
jgi:hypothetical protein